MTENVKRIPGGRKKLQEKRVPCPECGGFAISVEGHKVERLTIGLICPCCHAKLQIGEKMLDTFLDYKENQ